MNADAARTAADSAAPGRLVLSTARLNLRELVAADAAFVLELLNDPDFIRNIADRGVRTLAAAADYIAQGPRASYAQHGFGLLRLSRRESPHAGEVPIGIAGLIRRDWLADVDIGYALLPAHRGQGYALEAAVALCRHGREVLKLPRIVAFTSPDNAASIGLLEKLGLRYARPLSMPGSSEVLSLFSPDGC